MVKKSEKKRISTRENREVHGKMIIFSGRRPPSTLSMLSTVITS